MGGAKVPIRDIRPERLTWNDGFLNRPNLPREATLTSKGVVEIIKSGKLSTSLPRGLRIEANRTPSRKYLLPGRCHGWLCNVSSVGRQYGLPLTPLEIHTMVHVVCAVSMYCFWLKVSKCLVNKFQEFQSGVGSLTPHTEATRCPRAGNCEPCWMGRPLGSHGPNVLLPRREPLLMGAASQLSSSEIFSKDWMDMCPGSENQSGPCWIGPSDTVTTLHPGDALISGFGYDNDENLKVTQLDVLRWTRAAREIHRQVGEI